MFYSEFYNIVKKEGRRREGERKKKRGREEEGEGGEKHSRVPIGENTHCQHMCLKEGGHST